MVEQKPQADFNSATGHTQIEEAKRRAARMVKEKQFFEEKAAEYRGNLESKQSLEKLDLDRKHDQQKARLDDELRKIYGEHKQKDKAALKSLDQKAEKSKLTAADKERREALKKNLDNVQQREKEQQDALKSEQAKAKAALKDKHENQKQNAAANVEAVRKDRQLSGWKPAPVIFADPSSDKSKISFQKPAESSQSAGTRQGHQITPESVSSAPRPYLAPKGARTGNLKPPEAKQATGKETSGKATGKGSGLDM